jgi:hypothetical protein
LALHGASAAPEVATRPPATAASSRNRFMKLHFGQKLFEQISNPVLCTYIHM